MKVPLILGPTASGKTALALDWVQQKAFDRPVEIISVDSALVYRGMDIGTAKPSANELARAPHHLIDVIDPLDSYSAAQFVRDATRLIRDIAERGHQPVLVGGTMLYARSLIYGIDELPAANSEVRQSIDQQALDLGWPALHEELAKIDPDFAASVSPNDSQRIQRGLEVARLTGKPMSSLFATDTTPSAVLARFTLSQQTFPWQPEFHILMPQERANLHAKIAQRFDAMLAAGLLEEVRHLRARGDLHLGLPSMRCVGYRQAWEYLDGKYDLAQLREQGIIATRQLAKRQITWLRGYFLPLEPVFPLKIWLR